MAPGSRGIGAVFVHLSGEDSDQMGDAFGKPRVPRRSWSRYLSNAPGLVDQLDFDVLGTVGKLALPTLCKVPDSRKSELGLVRYGSRDQRPPEVFLVRLRAVFRSGFRLDPDKFLAIREFHVVHECVFFPTHPGLWINLLRVRKTLRASVATSVRKVPEFSAQPYFVRPVFTRMVDIAPDVGFRQSWYRRKAGATYFPKVQALHRGELGFARYDPANGGRWNVPYAKGFDHNFLVSRPFWARKVSNRSSHIRSSEWSRERSVRFSFRSGQQSGQTLVKLGQPWSNLVKTLQTPGNVSRTAFRGFLGQMDPSRAGKRLGQTLVKLRSTLVKLGQPWSNLGKCVLDLLPRECLMRPGFVGSYGLGPGRPAIACRHSRKSCGVKMGL
uniref:Uncharacterized protein n=1 Tax=Fagus sylvatica TaxID=28930 RepID=A0A2N9G062_FAGSY